MNFEIEQAERVLQALDAAGLPVQVALWVYLAEYGDWRLLLSSKAFDEIGRTDAYRLVREKLSRSGVDVDDPPTMILMRTNETFIKGLRRVYAKMKRTYGLRLGGLSFGDRFIEDAFVYRIK